MSDNPINLAKIQRIRRVLLYILALLILGIRAFAHTDYVHIGYTIIGGLLVVLMAVGRAYCMVFIAERKSSVLVSWGPYSLCRNPLYLFSVLGAFGVGLLLQSVILAMVAGVAVYAIFIWVIMWEERNLTHIFGQDYHDYCAQTPWRILPNFTTYRAGERVSGGQSGYLIARTFKQAILLLCVFGINPIIIYLQQYWQTYYYLP